MADPLEDKSNENQRLRCLTKFLPPTTSLFTLALSFGAANERRASGALFAQSATDQLTILPKAVGLTAPTQPAIGGLDFPPDTGRLVT